MKINYEKLESAINEMMIDTAGRCCESSAFIGNVNKKVIKISVMTLKEAKLQDDFECVHEKYKCIE